MKNQQLKLTEDSISSLAIKMAVPVSIGFFFHTMFNVVDTYFASKISSIAVAAITISFPMLFSYKISPISRSVDSSDEIALLLVI